MASADKETYTFDPDRAHQGLAVVIVNFYCGKHKRDGADRDLKNMKETFKRLGFEVECHENVNKSKLLGLLDRYSKDLANYSCFAFGISSHGMEVEHMDKKNKKLVNHHVIMTSDGAYIYTKDIIESFSEQKCGIHSNKPKLFFIQACRIPQSKASSEQMKCGIGFDHGVPVPRLENQGQRSSGDKPDYQEAEVKDNLSDTNGENNQPPAAAINDTFNNDQEGIGEIEQDLERTHLENQAKELGRANQSKDQNTQIASNQIKENDPQPVADHSKGKTSSMVTGNEVDAAGRKLCPPGGDTSGDVEDAPRGTQYSTDDLIHIVLVPCHKDMLIMFGSPQGHYAIRNQTDGSYMFKYLHEVVEEHYGNGRLRDNQTSFLHVLVGVAARMAEGTYFGGKMYKTVPCLVHKLSKDIVFSQGAKMIS